MEKTQPKKVVIIGSGVAGLSAAIYAARSGFNTIVYEKHITAGGLCCSWRRKDYTFEGGMHWLTGSSPNVPLNQVWREVGALKENNPITNRDPFYQVLNPISNSGDAESPKEPLALWRDLKKTRQILLEYSPRDRRAIKRFCRDVKMMSSIHFMTTDIPFLKTKTHLRAHFLEILKMGSAIIPFLFLVNMSVTQYIARFKDKNIRALLRCVVGYRYNALSFIYSIAAFASGDCGYPKGGSTLMIKNMVETYESLGGTIEYKSLVTKIVLEDKILRGVIVNGVFKECDAVIVTQDARSACEKLFDWTPETFVEKYKYRRLKKAVIPELNMFICLGTKCNLTGYPTCAVLPLETPFVAGGLAFTEFRINIYNGAPYAPNGGSVITCILLGDSYDYWTEKKSNGTYKDEKDALAKSFIKELCAFIPDLAQNVEVTDVATPLTYERYCGTYKGSWMSVWSAHQIIKPLPMRIKNTPGLYFAGQRTIVPGGLPCAVVSGRKVAQFLSRDNNTEFVAQ